MSTKSKIFVDFFAALIALAILSACGTATPAPTATAAGPTVMVNLAGNPLLGNILVDEKGMTLYEYTKDTSGVSNCTGQCAVNWPPLVVPTGTTLQPGAGVTAPLGLIQRADGTMQVAADGVPLYYFIKDKKNGDVFGQGVGGIWFVLDPDGQAVKTALPTAAPTSSPVVIKTANNPVLGNILTDGAGMTLYLYTKDAPGVSNCTGQCAVSWPPLLVAAGAVPQKDSAVTATLGTIQRADGTTQVTVNQMPVYYWIKDTKPGDVSGQGVGGIWFVLDPSGAMVKTALPPA
jgi:predicted lipoprotein with Yx(FWY)xxD motif